MNEEEFAHPELNAPVIAIGGNYVFTHEKRIPFKEREILYYIGIATFDTTCCGAGGCAYAFVPGFILSWKNNRNEKGVPVSSIELVKDPSVQDEVRALILKNEMVNQINFHV